MVVFPSSLDKSETIELTTGTFDKSIFPVAARTNVVTEKKIIAKTPIKIARDFFDTIFI